MKIKAFTIMELIVALAISAIVTTIGYSSITAVSNTVRLRNEKTERVEKLQELRFILTYDLSSFHDWDLIGNRLQSEEGGVYYTFGENSIERLRANNNQVFTFDKLNYAIRKNPTTGRLTDITLEATKANRLYRFPVKIWNDIRFNEIVDN